MKKNLLLSLALATVCMSAVQAQTVLFESPFTSDYNTQMPYRIPAIVKTSNDELIVFSDKRHGGGDVGQYQSNSSAKNAHVDLVYKRSTDNGATWSNEQTIIKGDQNMGYGDVAVVADRENPNNIVFFCAAGNVFFTNSTSSNPLRCFRFRSSDGGVTWSNEEVTSDIYDLFSYTAAFFSSGRICQSSQIKVGNYYRLYAALCVNGTNSIVIYSDDFGGTWNVLGGSGTVAVSGGNEAKCEELPNGSVLVSSRVANGRYFNVFNYTDKAAGKGSWNGRGTGLSGKDGGATNGEILLVPAEDSKGNKCNILLQSLPIASGRSKVGICWRKLSSDNITQTSEFTGSDWTVYDISKQTSAYSTMVLQADGNIGFVWEELLQSYGTGGYDITYMNLSLSTITGGQYTYDASSTGNGGEGEGEGDDKPTTTVTKYRFKNVQKGDNVYYFQYAGETEGLKLVTSESNATLYTRTVNNDGTYSYQDSEDGYYLIWSGRDLSSYQGYNSGLGYSKEYNADYCNLTISEMTAGGNVESFTGTYYTIKGKRQDSSGGNADVYFVIKNEGPKFDGASAPFYNSNYSSAFVIEEVEVEVEGGEVEKETVATPVIAPASGTFTGSTEVTITCATDGATIYYSTDGTEPGTEYTGTFTLSKAGTYTVKAIAVKDGCNDSEEATATIVVEEKTIEVPTSIINCDNSSCKSASYSTLYLDHAVKIPGGVNVYRGVLDTEKATLTLYKIRTGVIPAQYAVIVENTQGGSSVTFTETENPTATPLANDLQGSLTAVQIANAADYYVLGHTAAHHVGFYHPNSTTLAAGKAYIYWSSSNARALTVNRGNEEDDTTGIGHVESTIQPSAVIYDLMGRRVDNPTRGMYIINGKKVFIQ